MHPDPVHPTQTLRVTHQCSLSRTEHGTRVPTRTRSVFVTWSLGSLDAQRTHVPHVHTSRHHHRRRNAPKGLAQVLSTNKSTTLTRSTPLYTPPSHGTSADSPSLPVHTSHRMASDVRTRQRPIFLRKFGIHFIWNLYGKNMWDLEVRTTSHSDPPSSERSPALGLLGRPMDSGLRIRNSSLRAALPIPFIPRHAEYFGCTNVSFQ